MNPVYSIHLRLYRAYEHLESLNRAADAFLDSKPYAVWREDNLQERTASWHMEVFEPPPLRLSIIMADCVHNMRSALDYLMWQLVSKYKSGRPSHRTQFPICVSEEDWLKAKRAMRYLPEDVLEYLDLLQPYKAVERGGPPDRRTILRLLHELSNSEKHRQLTELAFHVTIEFPPRTDYRFDVGSATIRDGSAIVAKAFPLTPNAQPQIDAKLSIDIALSLTPIGGIPIRQTLARIYEGITGTLLPPFERYLLGS